MKRELYLMEIASILMDFIFWFVKKVTMLLAVLIIIWMLLSWYDIISDNISVSNTPIAEEGNFFVEVMKIGE